MRKKLKQPDNKFLEAIKFLELCQTKECKDGDERLSYCRLSGGRAVAFNGVCGAGCFIEEDIEACPHSVQLALALSRCGETYAITRLPESLMVRSGEFGAYVPCVDPSKLLAVTPDPLTVPLGQPFMDALAVVAPLASDKAEFAVTACVQIGSGSMIATNREVVIESWHGYNLPSINLPKPAIDALLDCKKQIVGIGIEASYKTATFWFDDGAWIISRLYLDRMPDLRQLIDHELMADVKPIDKTFFDIVKQIAPFSTDGNIYCTEETISSHWDADSNHKGATLSIPFKGAPYKKVYTIKGLKLIAKLITGFEEFTCPNATLFFGNNLRGAISHKDFQNFDDIPF